MTMTGSSHEITLHDLESQLMTILSIFFSTQAHAQEKRDFPLYTRSVLGNRIWECLGGKNDGCVFLVLGKRTYGAGRLDAWGEQTLVF